MKLLAISGSLRDTSTNTRLLRALALLASPQITVASYAGLAGLPHFNPDLDIDPAPPTVRAFREHLLWADAIVISSPEYAHGVPGSLKNALDWVVGSGEFADKPVALLNASQRATIAHASLAETLRTMSAALVAKASLTIPLLGCKLDEYGIAADPQFSAALRAALRALTERAPHL